MVKKSSAIIACVVVCVFSLAIAGILTFSAYQYYLVSNHRLKTADEQRLDEIRQIYHNYALDDVPDGELYDGAAKGMAWGSGDVYSSFFTAEEYGEFQEADAGKYVGIGVSVNVDPVDGLITAVNIYRHSPAEAGGMQPGDKIVKVDDTDVAGLTLEQTVKLVRGEAGSPVRITVLRDDDMVELTLVRAEVKVDYAEGGMKENGIGYIKIQEFSGDLNLDNNAATMFDNLVQDLKEKGMKGLILDLRNNPGGGLDIVSPIADELFPAGPIITMEDRDGRELPNGRIMSDEAHLGIPMVVLINENSASASELLCGGIQDYKVGTLIGVTTYGKGVGQQFATLSDGSVLKYTAFKYLTGGGRCPQEVGIQPDITVELPESVKKNPLKLCTPEDTQYMRALQEIEKMIR